MGKGKGADLHFLGVPVDAGKISDTPLGLLRPKFVRSPPPRGATRGHHFGHPLSRLLHAPVGQLWDFHTFPHPPCADPESRASDCLGTPPESSGDLHQKGATIPRHLAVHCARVCRQRRSPGSWGCEVFPPWSALAVGAGKLSDTPTGTTTPRRGSDDDHQRRNGVILAGWQEVGTFEKWSL